MDDYKKSINEFYTRCFTGRLNYFKCYIAKNHSYKRYKTYKNYCLLKKYENSKNIFSKLKYVCVFIKYARLSSKINVMINTDTFIKNLYFEHYNIVINKKAVIGQNLTCIGNNCIGGNDVGAPTIGNNVFLGYGAMIIGNVKIASNVKIGAGAIITRDIVDEGSTYVGVNKRIK